MAKRKAKRKARSGTRKTARQPKKKRAARRARPAKRSTQRSTKRAAKKPARRAAARKRPKMARPAKRVVSRKTSKAKASRPKPAALQRERRRLAEQDVIPGPPSTLGYDQKASSAESGHQMYNHKKREHTEGGTVLTGGEVDSDWNDAYSSGEETPGGDMSTPDQDVVEEIGRALGVEYEDAEELKGADKILERDRKRWEFDPASSEDYKDRAKKQ